MVDTENLHTSINNALINIENLKRWLVKIEQEFTDDNYPNWHFDVVIKGTFSNNPVGFVMGKTIEKGLNIPVCLEVKFNCCDKSTTIININWMKFRFQFQNSDFEYDSIFKEILKIKVIPFDMLRKICDILNKAYNITDLGLIKKQLKIELKKFNLNKDF